MGEQQKTYYDLITYNNSFYHIIDDIKYLDLSNLYLTNFNNPSLIKFIKDISNNIIENINQSSYVNKDIIDYIDNFKYNNTKKEEIINKLKTSLSVDTNILKGYIYTDNVEYLKIQINKQLNEINKDVMNIATIITNIILYYILYWDKIDANTKSSIEDIVEIVYEDIIKNITNVLSVMEIDNICIIDYIGTVETLLTEEIISNIISSIENNAITNISSTNKSTNDIKTEIQTKFGFININYLDDNFKKCFTECKHITTLYNLVYRKVIEYINNKKNNIDLFGLPLIFQQNDLIDSSIDLTATIALNESKDLKYYKYNDFIKFIEFVKFLYNTKYEDTDNNKYNTFVFNAILQVLLRIKLNDNDLKDIKTALLLLLENNNLDNININDILKVFKNTESGNSNILANTSINVINNIKNDYTNAINSLTTVHPQFIFDKMLKVYTSNLMKNIKITEVNKDKFKFKDLVNDIAYDEFISHYIYDLEKSKNLKNSDAKKAEIKETFKDLFDDNLEMNITNAMKYVYVYDSSTDNYTAKNVFDAKEYLKYRVGIENSTNVKIKKEKSEKNLESYLLCINENLSNLRTLDEDTNYYSFILTLNKIYDNLQIFIGKFIFIDAIGGINDYYESGQTTTKLIGNMYLKNYANLLLNIYINYFKYGLENLYNKQENYSVLTNYIYHKTFLKREDKENDSISSGNSGTSSKEEIEKLKSTNKKLTDELTEKNKTLEDLTKAKTTIADVKDKLKSISDVSLKTSMESLLEMIENIINMKTDKTGSSGVLIDGFVNNKGIRKTQEINESDMEIVSKSRLGYSSVWGNAMIREMNKRGGIKGGAEITEITDKEIKGLVQIIQNYLINSGQDPKEDLKDILIEVLNKVELHNKIVKSLNKTMQEIDMLEEEYNKKMVREHKTEVIMSGGDSKNYNDMIKKAYNLDVRRQQLQSEIIEKFNSLY